eukprot:g77885.t1
MLSSHGGYLCVCGSINQSSARHRADTVFPALRLDKSCARPPVLKSGIEEDQKAGGRKVKPGKQLVALPCRRIEGRLDFQYTLFGASPKESEQHDFWAPQKAAEYFSIRKKRQTFWALQKAAESFSICKAIGRPFTSTPRIL